MFGPWLNRRWLCFPSVHLEEWVIILAPHFRQTDGFSFGKLVYIRFFYYCSWRFFNSHSFECKTFVDCRENFTLGARGLFFLFLLFLSDAKRRGKKKNPLVTRTEYLISMQISYHVSYQTAEMTSDRAWCDDACRAIYSRERVKAGVHAKAVFTSLNTAFLPISRSCFKRR